VESFSINKLKNEKVNDMYKLVTALLLITYTYTVSAQFPPFAVKPKQPLIEKEITGPFMAPSPMVCGSKKIIDKILHKHELQFTSFYAKSELVEDAITLFYYNDTTKKFLVVRNYKTENVQCILEFGIQIDSNSSSAAHNFKHKHKRTRSSKVIMCGGGRYPCAVQKR
jgi:hypothetical protein